MSLATRCTHCDTIFKVVQDQLKVSEGWVRCGRCNQVFNALEGLFDMEREAPPQRSNPAPEAAMQSEQAAAPSVPAVPTAPPPAPPASSPADAFEVGEPQESAGAVTHFDLDLPPSDQAPLPAAPIPAPAFTPPPVTPASLAAHQAPQAPQAAPLASAPASSLPVTDESDALDSRYLLTSEQAGVPVRRRRRRGPEFADAQFPADLVADSQHWETDWSPSDLGDTAASTVPGGHLSQLPPMDNKEPSMGSLLTQEARDSGPATLPSRFETEYQPEQPLPPPSQRKGRSGTRGRLPAPPAPEFIQQAERKAIWRHPLVRGVFGLIALMLAALLAGQAAHHWRDQLASHHPELRPALAQWCELAQCTLSPPLQLDDLQVDSITLVKTNSVGDDTYRMTVIIHNKAPVALAWPHVDITLTNASGEVVTRRAFDARSAQQLVPGDAAANEATGPVPEAAPPDTSTTLQWQLRAPDLQLASYTAELFYP